MTPVNGSSPGFDKTVDVIRAEHLTSARTFVHNPILLQELESEIEHDCEGLRSFLFAAQVYHTALPMDLCAHHQ